MNKKEKIFLLMFLIFLVIPLSSAFNASSDVYSIGSYHMGSAGNAPEGTDFSARNTLTYQQAGNDNATSTIHSLNLGWFKRIIIPSEEAVEEAAPSTGVGGGGGGVSITFDVDILEFESPVRLGDFFDFTYFVKGIGDINNDVTIDFHIEKDGEIITSGSTVIFMGINEEKTGTASLFLPSDIESGTYRFVLQASFQIYKGEAHRTIEITVKDGEATIDKLFDISFLIVNQIIENSDELLAIVTLENFREEPTAVDLTFIIFDETGNEIHKEEDSIIVEKEEVFRKSFIGLNLPEGKYVIVLQTLHDVDVFDEFRQDFEIRPLILFSPEIERPNYIILIIVLLLILILIIIILKKRRKKEKEERKKKKVKKGKKEMKIYKKLKKEVGDL